jgi:hypothetical protein
MTSAGGGSYGQLADLADRLGAMAEGREDLAP